jgi:thiol:disulfide interchange protein
MSFVHHAGEDGSVQFRLGLMFTAGVLVSFLTLALVVIGLQAAGELVGWGFQFQNPVFVVVMAAVVFAFGLSLFGVYEIILPMQIGGGSGRKGAYAESFLNGVLATALATPCTAPLLGSALGFAFSQPAAVVLAIFLTTGLGLSLPYLVLSLNPGWLRFVPKPGAWMDRFKQFMGFLLMATLIWLLWVLGQQVGLDALASVMAFLLVLGFALWLYGSMLTLSSSTARRSVVWAVVLVLVVGGWTQFVGDRVSAEAVAANAPGAAHGDARAFSVEALEAEVAAGKTVFIDFTAAWCMTCKVNERTVIQSDEVQQTIEELGVVTLVGDWTNRDETITRVLRQYGRSGVPFYAVFPAGRIDDPIVLPEVITRSLLIDALEQAGPSRTVASR